MALGVAVWAAVCLLRRRCGAAAGAGLRRARRARYAPVSDPEGLQMLPKSRYRSVAGDVGVNGMMCGM